MGTHPIFESDFDCLTESKIGATRFTNLVRFVAEIGNGHFHQKEAISSHGK